MVWLQKPNDWSGIMIHSGFLGKGLHWQIPGTHSLFTIPVICTCLCSSNLLFCIESTSCSTKQGWKGRGQVIQVASWECHHRHSVLNRYLLICHKFVSLPWLPTPYFRTLSVSCGRTSILPDTQRGFKLIISQQSRCLTPDTYGAMNYFPLQSCTFLHCLLNLVPGRWDCPKTDRSIPNNVGPQNASLEFCQFVHASSPSVSWRVKFAKSSTALSLWNKDSC